MTHESIHAYESKLTPDLAKVVRLLRKQIETSLPAATGKVWHGHPVWFDGDNPIVGYDVRRSLVTLLFWNGRVLNEPELVPIAGNRAAGIEFRSAGDVDGVMLRRCLNKARNNVFDSVGYFRALREKAKRHRAKTPSQTKTASRAKARSDEREC